MKKINNQSALFEDFSGTKLPIDGVEPIRFRPFSLVVAPEPTEDLVSEKQVILGNIPSKSNCYKIITFKSKDPSKQHASLAKTKALKDYENKFFIQCNKYRNKMIDGYFQIEVDVFYPSQRSDLDNSLKVLMDCLQKIKAYANDNKCTRIVANKFLDASNPRIEFIITKSMTK